MKILLDTSVMVASILKNHAHHARAMRWQHRIVAGELSGVLAAHSLAEIYSTLTRMPPPARMAPKVAWEAIERNVHIFDVVALTEAEVVEVLTDLSARSIGGRPVYDALIAAAARKVNVDLLLTFNAAHFHRVAPDLWGRIQEP